MGYTDSQGRYRATKQALVPILLSHLAAGTPLAAFADGAVATPGLALDDSEAVGVRWNNHATPAAAWARALSLVDRQPGTDVKVHVIASKTGATIGDATTFTVAAFFQPVGALRDADANAGGATSAMTGNATSKTVQRVSLTIAAADVPNASATDPVPTLSLSVKPTDGTLGTDDVTIHQVLLEYTAAEVSS